MKIRNILFEIWNENLMTGKQKYVLRTVECYNNIDRQDKYWKISIVAK